MAPCALLAAIIVKVGSEAVFRYVIVVSIGFEPWAPWVATAVASALMGSIFVAAATGVAPTAKHLVSSLALAAVVLWGAVIVLTSIDDGNVPRMFAVALCGASGGAVTHLLTRWRAL